jgi:hypothetical protein
MTRVRTKCKMNREISRNWFASAWETLRLLHSTRMWGITRDGQGYHHLSPTPQPGALSYSKVPVHLSTTPVYKETTHTPRIPTLRIDKQEYGQT